LYTKAASVITSMIATLTISLLLRGPVNGASCRPSLRVFQAVNHRAGTLLAKEPSFFDKILFGTSGRPQKKDSELKAARKTDLAAFFAQLDADGNGALDRDELKRALMLIGLQKIDFDAAFDALDIDGDGMVTFEEFNAALPSSTRAAIVARINEYGVLPSLYLPPEQWSETRSQAELQWEQKVQFQALRSGNKLRQNDILQNELDKL
jgi:Ca2+-binding EF-hand superfamily protein